MNKTTISYLTHTWNPLAMRCTKCSPARDNCWHLRWANRHAMRAAYAGDAPPLLVEHRLEEPLETRKPARIGVQFMGDLFHEDVPEWALFHIFETMTQSPRHTFFLLTKRPRRLLEFASRAPANEPLLPPNIHIGVTAENQKMADERIPVLLQIPAAFYYVSLEPLLSSIYLDMLPQEKGGCPGAYNVLTGEWWPAVGDADIEYENRITELPRLNLAIVGGETGPGARPMHPDWARGIRDQCKATGVGFHFKSHGEWLHESQFTNDAQREKALSSKRCDAGDGFQFVRVGAKAAGHLLDGVEHRGLE